MQLNLPSASVSDRQLGTGRQLIRQRGVIDRIQVQSSNPVIVLYSHYFSTSLFSATAHNALGSPTKYESNLT